MSGTGLHPTFVPPSDFFLDAHVWLLNDAKNNLQTEIQNEYYKTKVMSQSIKNFQK